MKKLFLLSLSALALAACSNSHHNPHHDQALENAIQACHKSAKNPADIQTCLTQRGFEMPKDHPAIHAPKPHKHSNPELEKAMKACDKKPGKKKDMAKFEACLKQKGFVKPANHP